MSKVSPRGQITVPAKVLREAGIAPGDELRVRVTGPGRLELERPDDFVARWAGRLTDVYSPGYLEELRDEWGK